MTSFGSHRRNSDRSLKVSISSYRHCSDLVRRRNGSGETIVVEEEQSPVVGLLGRYCGFTIMHKSLNHLLATLYHSASFLYTKSCFSNDKKVQKTVS